MWLRAVDGRTGLVGHRMLAAGLCNPAQEQGNSGSASAADGLPAVGFKARNNVE